MWRMVWIPLALVLLQLVYSSSALVTKLRKHSCPLGLLLSSLLSDHITVTVCDVSSTISTPEKYNVKADETSVSGVSSGGYMAVQFHVAFSGTIKGAGITAGGSLA